MEYAIGLGRIIRNLHALEMVLRVFLGETHKQTMNVPTAVGVMVPETYFTSYHSLGQLIAAYNQVLTIQEATFALDYEAVTVRDAIAHGRLLTTSPHYPLTLYKFGKPTAASVPLELLEVISERWLNEKTNLVFSQIKKVHECGKGRNYASFGELV